MFQIAPGLFKNKTKLLFVSKNFWKRNKSKAFGQNFLLMIENFLFRSRILFQKRIYSIFFGTKAAKRKLSILKERWFDMYGILEFTSNIPYYGIFIISS